MARQFLHLRSTRAPGQLSHSARLHKIELPKRFELTAAPAGEFLNAKQLYDRYVEMGSAELAKTNAELARNYIRNYYQVRGLVPYVIGRFAIMEARELGPNDVFHLRDGRTHQRSRSWRIAHGARLSGRNRHRAADEADAERGFGNQTRTYT